MKFKKWVWKLKYILYLTFILRLECILNLRYKIFKLLCKCIWKKTSNTCILILLMHFWAVYYVNIKLGNLAPIFLTLRLQFLWKNLYLNWVVSRLFKNNLDSYCCTKSLASNGITLNWYGKRMLILISSVLRS